MICLYFVMSLGVSLLFNDIMLVFGLMIYLILYGNLVGMVIWFLWSWGVYLLGGFCLFEG